MKRKAKIAVANCGHHVNLPRVMDVECHECEARGELDIEKLYKLAMAWLNRTPGCSDSCQCCPCSASRDVVKQFNQRK